MAGRLTSNRWRQIEQIFHRVLDSPQSAREELLRELTRHDRDLEHEVRTLIAHDDEARRWPDLQLSSVATAESQRSIGQDVNGYRLLYPIAVSPFSEVWCAEERQDDQSTRSRVAIKFLCAGRHDQRRIERFKNEVLVLSRFRHPGIAELLDFGQDHASPYFVMRFIAGLPITQFADQEALTLSERVELIVQVFDAVAYAHRRLVVHRDLKPANILVCRDRTAIVLDFGISKYLGQEGDQASSPGLTATQERPMTPAYASPEQVRGDPITTATDAYALGLILYELLTGHHPYSTTANPKAEKLFDRICTATPRPPSQVVLEPAIPLETYATAAADLAPVRSTASLPDASPVVEPLQIALSRGAATPAELARLLRERFDAIVLKAIAKNPEDRYQSLADFRNDLHSAFCRIDVEKGAAAIIRRRPFAATAFAALLGALTALGLLRAIGSRKLAAPQRNSQAASETGRTSSQFLLQEGSQPAEQNDFEENRRIDLVRTCSDLGRPATALQFLGPLPTDEEERRRFVASCADPYDVQMLIARVLLDAGQSEAASKWFELPIPNEKNRPKLDADALLLGVQVRSAIGWAAGAHELLDQLDRETAQLQPIRIFIATCFSPSTKHR